MSKIKKNVKYRNIECNSDINLNVQFISERKKYVDKLNNNINNIKYIKIIIKNII